MGGAEAAMPNIAGGGQYVFITGAVLTHGLVADGDRGAEVIGGAAWRNH